MNSEHIVVDTIASIYCTYAGIIGRSSEVAATTATSSGDFTFKGWTLEYLGGK
jgi:hypothetical protein